MVSRTRTVCCVIALLATAGCGGGDGDSGSTAVPPGPAPTPSPAPTSSPSPSAPSAATAYYRASIGAPLIANVTFDANGSGAFGDTIDNNKNDVNTTSNRLGEYGRDAPGRLTSIVPPENSQGLIQRVGGISILTGYNYSRILTPTDTTQASPVSYLLGAEYSDKLARNATLDLTPEEIRKFDAFGNLTSGDAAIAARARKIVALNYKLLVHAGYESSPSTNKTISIHPNLEGVAKELDAGPVDFNNPEHIRRILDRSPIAARTDAEGRRAAAQLIARFGEASDQYLTGPDQAAAVEYGLRIIVLRELEWLFNGVRPAQDINHVLRITVYDIVSAFREFQAIPRPNTASGKFIPVVDYLGYDLSRSPSIGVGYLTANDVEISLSAYTNPAAFTVVGVRVPSQFQSQLSVALSNDGNIKIDQPGTGTGLVWFEYQVRDSDGGISSSRVYFYQRRDF